MAEENTEKIIINSTNSNIAYYEPNNEDDRSIPYPYEDMCIAIDLQVTMDDRTSFGRSCEGTNGYNRNMKSFISGKIYKTPDGDQKQYLTTSYTNIGHDKITVNGEVGGENEALGIESININYDSWFYPQVEIKFTDVRGESLMQPQEEGNAYTDMTDGDATEILGGSFFKSLFTFPYPKFVLFVKGYYGKEVSYDLSVSDFQASFNASNGNFDVTVKFIGFMYGIYSDIPMQYLTVSPYTEGGKKYWDANPNFYFADEKGKITDTHIYTYKDFITNLAKISGGIPSTPADDVENTNIQDGKEVKGYIDTLKLEYDAFINGATAATNGSVVGFVITGDNHDILVFNDKGVSFDKAEGIQYGSFNLFALNMIYANAKLRAMGRSELTIPNGLFSESDTEALKIMDSDGGMWTLVKSPYSCGSDISRSPKPSNRKNFNTSEKDNKFGIIHISNKADGSIGVYEGAYYNSIQHVKLVNDKIKNEIISFIKENGLTRKFTDGNYLCISIDTTFKKQCDDFLSQYDTEYQESQESLDKSKTARIMNLLGYKPSIGNVNKMMFAHLDTFISIFYDCLDNIKKSINEKKREIPNGVDTDVPVDSGLEQLPPFTAFYTKDNNGKRVYLYPGEDERFKDLDEVKFVEELVETANNLGINLRKEMEAIEATSQRSAGEYRGDIDEDYSGDDELTDETSSVDAADFNVENLDFDPLTRHDFAFIQDGNPWKDFIEQEFVDKSNPIAAIIRAYIVRYLYFEYFNEFGATSKDDLAMFARIDAKNFLSGNSTSTRAKACFASFEKSSEEDKKKKIREILTSEFSTIVKYIVPNGKLMIDTWNDKGYDAALAYSWIKNTDTTYLPTSFAPFKKDYFTNPKIEDYREFLSENTNHDFIPFNGTQKNDNKCILVKNSSSNSVLSQIYTHAKEDNYSKVFQAISDKEDKVYEYKGAVADIVGTDGGSYTDWVTVGEEYNTIVNPFGREDGALLFGLIKGKNRFVYTEKSFYQQNTITDLETRHLAKAFYFLTELPIQITEYSNSEGYGKIKGCERLYGSLLKEGAVLWLYKLIDIEKKSNPLKFIDFSITNKVITINIHRDGTTTGPYDSITYNISSVDSSRRDKLIDLFLSWAKGEFLKINDCLEIRLIDTDTEKLITTLDGAKKYNEARFDYHKDNVTYEVKNKNSNEKKHIEFVSLNPENNAELQTLLKKIFCYKYYLWELGEKNNEKFKKNAVVNDDLITAIKSFITNVNNGYVQADGSDEDGTIPDYTQVTEIDEPIEDDNTLKSAPKTTNGVKLACYLTLKNLFDRHFCGKNDIYWKICDDKTSEYNKFRFVDSRYRDITYNFPVNLEYLSTALQDNAGYSDKAQEPTAKGYNGYTFYEMLHRICADNGMILLALPMPFGKKKEEDIVEMFTPQPFTSLGTHSAYDASYIGVYSHQPASNLDIKYGQSSKKGVKYEYKCDGFDFTNAKFKGDITADKVFTRDPDTTSYTVPAFGVTYAKGNQSYFKNITVDMSNPQMTDSSIQTTLAISSNAAKTSSSNNSTYVYGADLFKVYSKYSYTCTVEMLGCMEIMPMMYFQLNNIPMFHGAYLITNVSHSISQGNMTTKFTGVKQAVYDLPIETFDSLGLTLQSVSSQNETNQSRANRTMGTAKSVQFNGVIQANTPFINNLPIHTSARTTDIKYLVIHYTAGSTSKSGQALQVANYYAKPDIKSTADFIVDDEMQVQYNPNPEAYKCRAVGYNNKVNPGFGNSNCVSIEICCNNPTFRTGYYPPANDGHYTFTKASLNNALDLADKIMKAYGIPITNVVRHFDTSGKLCPGIEGWNTGNMIDGRQNNENAWKEFKEKLAKGERY